MFGMIWFVYMLPLTPVVYSNLRLGEPALYPPSEVRDPYRILHWVIVTGGSPLEENTPLLQLIVSTSDTVLF